MFKLNTTKVTEFSILGFQGLQIFSPLLFVPFFLIYTLAVVGNLLIIVLVLKSHNLKSPMYFFFTQLSVSDILLTTNIAPYMIHLIINGGGKISVAGCIIQYFLYGFSAAAQCLLLTVMSYDRYLAICWPLRYTSIMDQRLLSQLVLWPWLLAFMVMVITVSLMCNLQFCGPNVIDHYFCDIEPILELSCSDHSIVDITYFIFVILFTIAPFFFIVFTYISIFITIFGIPSSTGRKKAFSTCSSHLSVVSTYYGTLITIYMVPIKRQSFNVNKVISLLYTLGTPFFNPIIYSLRNQEIKTALVRCFLALWSSNAKISI
ncbi:olfactory receptor 11A1-like [Spea bombifrons]|uniref:olfactory receptor 11A1-like n=1 Tax=Spea bombifrons TaxID=233779 RepID=UPI00234A511C|nr:olfactory receptor 11A1-like [Spea bombifrons]